jgi:hypothetical protein
MQIGPNGVKIPYALLALISDCSEVGVYVVFYFTLNQKIERLCVTVFEREAERASPADINSIRV